MKCQPHDDKITIDHVYDKIAIPRWRGTVLETVQCTDVTTADHQ